MHKVNFFKNQRSCSVFLLIVTAILWSLGGLLIKMVDWNPMAIAGTRSFFTSLILLLYLRKPKFTWSGPQIGAAIAYVATVFFFVSATKLTTAANAILLQFTAPIYVASFGNWLLKEKTKTVDWIVVFTVLGGMALFFLDHLSLQSTLGIIIGISSGISFAFFTIFMRMQKNESPLESVLLGNIATVIVGLPFMFQTGPARSGWIILVVMGVIQLGLPYILYSIAIKHVSALDAVLIPVIEPLLNPVWVFLLLGEKPGPWALVGGLIVVSSITLRNFIPLFKFRKNNLIRNRKLH